MAAFGVARGLARRFGTLPLDTSTPRARTAPNGPDDGGLLPLELASTVAGEVEAAVAVAGPDGVTLVAVVRVLGDGSASSP